MNSNPTPIVHHHAQMAHYLPPHVGRPSGARQGSQCLWGPGLYLVEQVPGLIVRLAAVSAED